MSSEAPPMTRASTKYEDIPPRFRKVWIQGHAESTQKKLDAPIDEFPSFMPLQQSNSETKLSKNTENSASRSQSLGASEPPSSSSSSHQPLQKRLRTDDSTLSESVNNSSGDGGLLEKEKHTGSAAVAYEGPSSIRRIVDSVVDTNVSLSTPPTSRSSSPIGNLNRRRKCRSSSRSRPATRSASPITGARSMTPTPSGWIPLTSRHSLRRFDMRPWGPKHLEYDYNEARKEFQGAAYYALGQYGYIPPKGVAKFKAPPPEELPSMSDLREIPEFARACRRLDAADRALEEALVRGETWENTAIPEEYLKFSLEDLAPDDFCTRRSDTAAVPDRSRSSVTLEEAAAAGQMRSSLLSRSTTVLSTSAPPSSSTSVAADDAQLSESTSFSTRVSLSDEKSPSSPASSSKVHVRAVALDSSTPQREARAASVSISIQAPSSSSLVNSEGSPPQLVRKRTLEEVEGDVLERGGTENPSDTGVSDIVPARANPPVSTTTSDALTPAGQEFVGRTVSDSTSGSGSGSGLFEMSSRQSPPTSISSSASNSTRSALPMGRVAKTRGRKRGTGRR